MQPVTNELTSEQIDLAETLEWLEGEIAKPGPVTVRIADAEFVVRHRDGMIAMIDARDDGITALDVRTIAEVIVKLRRYSNPEVAFTALRARAASTNWVIPPEGSLPN
jgi:hypothetical protein